MARNSDSCYSSGGRTYGHRKEDREPHRIAGRRLALRRAKARNLSQTDGSKREMAGFRPDRPGRRDLEEDPSRDRKRLAGRPFEGVDRPQSQSHRYRSQRQGDQREHLRLEGQERRDEGEGGASKAGLRKIPKLQD